ncbi:MAG: metallopeptidase, partial [Ideonella sp.]|nr:metallopeptidase [Ideonella sp.]
MTLPIPAARLRTLSLSLLAAFAATGCASLQSANQQANAATPAAAPVASGAASGAGARPDPAAPKPFDEVIKGATRQAGYLPLWRKDEKVWIELTPAMLDQPILVSVNIAGSVGERGLYGSQMGPSWLGSFRKVGATQVQLIALNTSYSADGTAMRATVEQAFSHSLLGSTTIVSAPNKDKAFLVDASFLLADLPGYSTALERAFRLPMALDKANSYFEKARVTDDLTTL